MSAPKTAIIVLNYNDSNTTTNFINAIKDYKILDLIVVVDNASTDGSYIDLKKLENKKIKVLKAEKNGGYGSGNNLGIKYAIEYLGESNIIVSNPDIEVSENVIANLAKGLNSNNQYAIIAPIVSENEVENKGWKLPKISAEILLNIPYFHKIIKSIILYPSKHYNKQYVEVDCVSGCFFMIRSSVMQKIQFFDENLFLYYEENVIGTKIKNIGLKTVIDMDSKIVHQHSVSISRTTNRLQKLEILKSSQMYYHTHYNNNNKGFGIFLLSVSNKFSLLLFKLYYSIKSI